MVLSCKVSDSQQVKRCNKIYRNPDNVAEFSLGEQSLMEYISKELFPIVGNCMARDKTEISSLRMTLTIDQNGQLIDVTVDKPYMSKTCKSELKRKMLTMKGWKPGTLKGKSVCSYYPFVIGCFYLEEE